MSEWIKHDGKGMPVDGYTRVCVRTETGEESNGFNASFWGRILDAPDWWDWRKCETVDRITHYRIIDNKED